MRSRPNRSLATILMACISVMSLILFTFNSVAAPFEPVSKPANRVFSTALLTPKGFPGSSQEGPSPMMQMPMVFPLFLQNQDFSSALVLTNAANQSTYADVILKATNGTVITRQRVEFTAHSQRTVEVQTLLMSAVSPATTGSITVMQSPEFDGTMVILGQLLMTNRASKRPIYIDEEIAMPSAQGSQILRAVADSGEGSPLVAITNLSESGQHVAMQCHAEKGKNFSKSVDLLAGETLLTEACSERTIHGAVIESFSSTDSQGPDGPIGISLTTDGMAGSFAAFGLVRHEEGDNQFFSNITFTDPKMLRSPTTIFAGVPVGPASLLSEGNYVPELSLANFSTEDLQVHVQYSQTAGTAPSSKELVALTIAAGASKKFTFDNLQGDPQLQNSFLITSNGAPGDVLAKLVSRNDSAPGPVELLGKDAQDTNNGGSNPWSIEQGAESTLLFFNHDQAPQIFNVLIASADGSQWDKDFKLAPMETMAISIGDIIQKQVKDDKGKTLPAKAVSGQISWWTVGTASGPGTGRLLQSNRGSGMARSFACGCPYILCGMNFFNYVTDLLLNTSSTPLDQMIPIICLYQVGDCTGTESSNSSSQALKYNWSSSNGATLQISGPSTNSSVGGYGASVGTGTMTGTVSATYYGPIMTCRFSGGGPTTVQVPTSLKFISVSVLPDGSTGAFGCPRSNNYGIMVDIKYQVLDQQSPAQVINSSSMTPHEKGTLFDGKAFDNDIGPAPGYPTSSATTAADGTFHDVPFGACQNTPIDTPRTASQNITIIFGGKSYPVRSQTWSVSAPGASSFGHGTITNTITSPGTGSDVTATR